MKVAPNSVSGRVVKTVMSPAGAVEVHPRAAAAADPVALHGLDGVGPVEQLEVVDQAVGVGGDAHHPLAHVALEDREVAAVGASVGGDLLVGDHRAQAGAPVDRRLADVRQAMSVDDRRSFLLRSSSRPRAARRAWSAHPTSNSAISSAIGRARPSRRRLRCRTRR